jgi:hypothetical protein
MLLRCEEIMGYRLAAGDDEIGTVADLYFDDHTWAVRYFVVDTGRWLPGKTVLVAAAVFGVPDVEGGRIDVDLTADQVKSAPPVSTELPVSRQHESDLAAHYGWPPYWAPPMAPLPPVSAPRPEEAEPEATEQDADPRLRSVREVSGYRVEAADEAVGHVEGFVVETDGWIVRYLVVDTRDLLPGRKVILAPAWIREVQWEARSVRVDLEGEAIRNSPPFDPDAPINREYEEKLYDYYGRPRERGA